MVILSWRRNLLSKIERIYSKKTVAQVPEIYAVAVVSFVDFLISYMVIHSFGVKINTPIVIISALILLGLNYTIYLKMEPNEKEFLVLNVIYFATCITSTIVLFL